MESLTFKRYNRLINLFLSSGEEGCIYIIKKDIYSERRYTPSDTLFIIYYNNIISYLKKCY